MLNTNPASSSDQDLPAQVAQLQNRVDRLMALQNVAQEVTAELDLKQLLHKILRSAITVMKCNAGSVLLFDPVTSELVFEVVEGGGGEALEKTRIPSDQGIAGAVFTRQEPIIVDNATRDARHLGGVASRFNMQIDTLMAVPMIAKGKPIGVLEAMNRISGEGFNQEDKELFLAFASQSAVAIENARLYASVIQERDRVLSLETGVRREVARNLHDGPAQILTAMVMTIRFLREALERAPERAGDEMIQLEALGQKALYQVRNILFDLRPMVLESSGLGPALQAYVERLRLVEPFNIELTTWGLSTRFKPNVESAIFMIVQEAVVNAKKHAAPHSIWIDANEGKGYLTISIRDDGSGFEVGAGEAASLKRNSFGLLTMRERAELAQGEVKIDSEPGHGTVITVRVPLRQAQPTS
ncbi:MAG: GAF domain-containing sensor histidine kinase [Anaerolineae bacterium]